MFETILLGLIQGLTEFLPVSSSGHLTLLHSFLGHIEDNVLFDVVLHVGTLLATLIFFRKKISMIIFGVFADYKNGEIKNGEWSRRAFYIFLAVIPTGIIGLFFKDSLEELFKEPKNAAIMLIVTGFILFSTLLFKDKSKTGANIGIWGALFVGLIQGFAILPGISRSGSTISAALFLGVKRDEAGEFSFLISIPAILGALLIKLKDVDSFDSIDWLPMLIGLSVSFFVGLLALSLLFKFVKTGKFWVFAPYCIILGGISLLFI